MIFAPAPTKIKMESAMEANTTEVIRSSFDLEGVKVELLWDAARNRFSVATRWANLAHFPIEFPSAKWKRIAMERASSTFEAVCINGATRDVARLAKKVAASLDSAFCVNAASYERAVLQRTNSALQTK